MCNTEKLDTVTINLATYNSLKADSRNLQELLKNNYNIVYVDSDYYPVYSLKGVNEIYKISNELQNIKLKNYKLESDLKELKSSFWVRLFSKSARH